MSGRHVAAMVTEDAEAMTALGSFRSFLREVFTGRKS